MDNLMHISNMDQDDQWVRDFAQLIGVYYWELIRNGIPYDLAGALTAEYHFLMLSQGGGEHE